MILFVIDVTFSVALVTVAAGLAIHGVRAGTLSEGQGIMLLGLSILLLEPMDQVGAFFYIGMGGLGSQRGIFGFLRGARASSSDDSVDVPESADPAVVVRDLRFGYDKPIFDGVSFTVARGARVAIVGRSGQGKSTLLALLQGELVPDSGTVAVGVSAVVRQSTWLFSGTIADNLRLARPEATDAELWQALERARVADEVRALPAGLDTQLGEQGLGLSGGQAQRISLARAVVSGRPVILLDEPTANVDLRSESEILSAIGDLGREFTVIMATHRAGAVEHMDRVLHVEGGKIVDVTGEVL
ncbi:ABC transporter ATP-binding protein [Corynebacterium phocae]|uniref:ATP-binding cassette domain-containing protein n=1 Tax=Corynebacterium phocae TaxID=161895 RepID=UPI000A9083D5|nr:ABC transporter ATP-binding protein [Corynebacterium phocae]